MTRDGDIPTIFNPRRSRAPSVLVTDEGVSNGPFTHADSVGSQQEATADQPLSPLTTKYKTCSDSLCSSSARKIYFGIWVTICVTASWVGATHCIKYLYIMKPVEYDEAMVLAPQDGAGVNVTAIHNHYIATYKAPFFTTWFVTNWTMLFFPLYFVSRLGSRRCESPSDILSESIRDFRDKGFTAGRFLTRCSLFCLLWVGTNYMYIRSLHILLATDVMALFATNISFVYLLSWVILHEQFVGIRIMAVILCDTGVALLAYMDGITGSPTLGGVVLATSAAAGSAVYKVLFKKVIGDATYGQVALFFSLIGMLNAALLWPLSLGLFLTGLETLHWDRLPWPALLAASALSLVANLLGNFSVALTYDLFITLGLITAVPVSAALDVVLYGAQFEGMKLAGMILIAVGFFLVMFPDNWPDYITRLLRRTTRIFRGKKYHHVESQCQVEQEEPARGPGSAPSGRRRLSHWIHPIAPPVALGKGQMTASGPGAMSHGELDL
ncbi:PREDICTED: putative thiamine transporter SLC35F3 isoform X3 [Nicrophorus vespilloides]|uniref:Thiamine transporter SLC35F3 isoform X3 n=1 Tax=Nicrophorus vespilloides TaxID=110193 RepID=A0ABM1M6Z1_NICVS|nr:PREDICTED: putative thiamine transporter SLC35F3 isoform X3 [Nicrophorus vespilloides]